MTLPDYVSAQTLKNFVLSKTPLYRTLVDAYWIQAPLHSVRVDYAVFHCLWFTDYFRSAIPLNDFGGGKALDTASGVELALKKLELLNGDWLQLPATEYEGMKHVEGEFLAFVGVGNKPDVPRTPIPDTGASKPKPPEDSEPVGESGQSPTSPTPPKPATPSSGGFWPFIRTLAGILGAINAVMFLLRLWLPAPIVAVLQAVIKFIIDLAQQHPAQALAIGVSSLVATHAIALKKTTPVAWQRPDKNPN